MSKNVVFFVWYSMYYKTDSCIPGCWWVNMAIWQTSRTKLHTTITLPDKKGTKAVTGMVTFEKVHICILNVHIIS